MQPVCEKGECSGCRRWERRLFLAVVKAGQAGAELQNVGVAPGQAGPNTGYQAKFNITVPLNQAPLRNKAKGVKVKKRPS